ncbi:MAG: hypothetical protein QM702_21540 [Rubrivivax sp.]
MQHVLPCLLVFVAGLLLVIVRQSRYAPEERNLLLLSFFAHVASAFALTWITNALYGGSDASAYLEEGAALAQLMDRDFSLVAPTVLDLVLQTDPTIPVTAAGTSTGTMTGMSAFFHFVLMGSTYAVTLVVAIASYFGKRALYTVYRETFPIDLHRRAMMGILLVPSVVFWSSGFAKEAFAVAALGWVTLGVHRITRNQYLSGLPLLLPSAIIWLTKPYVLFPLVAAGGLWVFWHRTKHSARAQVLVVSPIYFLLCLALALGALVLLNQAFPEYGYDHFTENTARQREAGEGVGGGSYFAIGDDIGRRSLAGQLAFAPIALVSTLFRPFIFEIRNPLMVFSGLENTVLLVLLVRALRRSGRSVVRVILDAPVLLFSFAFVIVFGVAVGLVTTNMGTLSRYRLPLVPFYVTLVLALDRSALTTKTKPQPAMRRRRAAPGRHSPRPSAVDAT